MDDAGGEAAILSLSLKEAGYAQWGCALPGVKFPGRWLSQLSCSARRVIDASRCYYPEPWLHVSTDVDARVSASCCPCQRKLLSVSADVFGFSSFN